MFLLFQIADFFPLNGQRQSCQTGCLIIWFKNQTKLLSPVIIFLTDFETDHQSYTTNCRGGRGKKVVFQFHSFPKAWLPFGILNLLIEFSLKQSGLLRLSGSSVRKKSSFTEEQGKHGSTQIMPICSFPTLP